MKDVIDQLMTQKFSKKTKKTLKTKKSVKAVKATAKAKAKGLVTKAKSLTKKSSVKAKKVAKTAAKAVKSSGAQGAIRSIQLAKTAVEKMMKNPTIDQTSEVFDTIEQAAHETSDAVKSIASEVKPYADKAGKALKNVKNKPLAVAAAAAAVGVGVMATKAFSKKR